MSSRSTAGRSRLAFVDAAKGIASQLIVLHHLAFYGPMSDYAQSLGPAVVSWLSEYARMAVQVFLVMGGFLAAQALGRDGTLVDKPPLGLLWRRYLKLAPPYVGALVLALAASAIARHLITHESIPDVPTVGQFAAHIVLLHGVLGFDGISAGVWYVAIDFQLYALLLGLLWLAQRSGGLAPACRQMFVLSLIAASLFYFNRDASWDNWAPYFFGAYGLGALTYWSVEKGRISLFSIATTLIVAVAALAIDFRPRIAIALATAITLGLFRYTGLIATCMNARFLGWLGQISYSVFLVHFPVCLVVNAVFEKVFPHEPGIQFFGILLAWTASIAGGALFHEHVECAALGWARNASPRGPIPEGITSAR